MTIQITKENVSDHIETYQIELKPVCALNEDDEPAGETLYWSGFCCKHGGCWEHSKTVISTVQAIIDNLDK